MPFIELLNFSSNKKEDLSNSKETEYELIITYIIPGIETKRNASIVRAYKVLLNDMVQDVVNKIEKLEPLNE